MRLIEAFTQILQMLAHRRTVISNMDHVAITMLQAMVKKNV